MTQPPVPDVLPGAGAHVVLLVDDEPQACKWFARLYGDEFVVWTAESVDQALQLLATSAHAIAVVLTDFRMPGRDGVALLRVLRSDFPHVVRLLASAYADKELAFSAVNQGQVEGILEKPLDDALTRRTLREALAQGAERARHFDQLRQRADSLRETLGFLAHEVATPLATVSGYLSGMRDRHQLAPQLEPGIARLSERRPGEVMHMIDAAQRRTEYAQSLVSTFVQSARDACMGGTGVSLRARDLVQAVQAEYPFEPEEGAWFDGDVEADFELPGRRDLLYLVLCTLVKNALMAMRTAKPERPRLQVRLTRSAPAPGMAATPAIVVIDNGPGIPEAVLSRLTREPVTTRAETGGSGMGLLFCQRVMTSLGGSVSVASELSAGASVTLHFLSMNPNQEPA
ncbi:hybrid sensor histidine kinase/response regulator [Hydrogenophaga sp. PAMC20947]|uniref:hybrid sensor histidine kinase/response regulator n=1 Tax=Hydrogenophaga sp. PAMC20947 TaxID=2565558 RepID=UPI00109E1C06|nr:hybrid sensor histidine kinase/response regulator [Hydrogenophaga sp. PAMC20947]QCB48051.1 hybrid sensor histidine kinase/response regulator [Hydrogenophaga sp. PAMC20947]